MRQVELVVEVGARGEFARLGDAQPDIGAGFETTREQQLQHDRTTVRLQLEHRFAGVRMRCRKVDREALVDRLAVGTEKGQIGRMARREHTRAQRSDHRAEVASRDANDADRAAPGRARNGDDGLVMARQHPRIFAEPAARSCDAPCPAACGRGAR